MTVIYFPQIYTLAKCLGRANFRTIFRVAAKSTCGSLA